jgi:NAD+ kinase
MLQRIAIYSKDNNPKTREGVQGLINEFGKRGIHIQLFQKQVDAKASFEGKSLERFSELGTLSALPDIVLSVGGDGTFLETVLKVKDLGIPVAGVNTGRMGFLANIPGDEIDK